MNHGVTATTPPASPALFLLPRWAILISPAVSGLLQSRQEDMADLHLQLAESYYFGAMPEDKTEMPDAVAARDWHLVSNDEYFYQNISRSWKAAGVYSDPLV